MRPPIWFLLAFTLSVSARAGDISVFVGPPGGAGCLRVFDEASVAPPIDPPALQGIRLLELDFAGRTALEELSAGGIRRFTDIPGAARVRLPGSHGSLYRYVRAEGTSSAAFGFMLVGADGSARSVFEVPAASDTSDPLIARVAVAPDGDAILVATRLACDGNLYEVDLATGGSIDLTSDRGPIALDGAGLLLQSSWGAAVYARGILRFDRSLHANARDIAFEDACTPSWFAKQIVASPNGRFAATIAGEDAAHSYAFVFDSQSSARCMSDEAGELSGAGYLPGARNGPWLAVSNDGHMCAWRTGDASALNRDLYLAIGSPSEGGAAQQITRDDLFDPTLDEVGLFQFRLGGSLFFAAGDPGGDGQALMRRMDLFRATPGAQLGDVDLFNLSQTSGDATPPFVHYGYLDPDRVIWVPDSQSFVLYASDYDGGSLMHVESDHGGTDEVMEEIAALDLIELVGGDILMATRAREDPDERGLLRMSTTLSGDPELVLPIAALAHVVHPTVGPDGALAFVVREGTDESLWRLLPGSGEVVLMTDRPLTYGPTLGFTSGGCLAMSAEVPGGATVFMCWSAEGLLRIVQTQSVQGFVLPGN